MVGCAKWRDLLVHASSQNQIKNPINFVTLMWKPQTFREAQIWRRCSYGPYAWRLFFFFWNFRFLVSPDFVLYTNTAKLLEIGAKITVWWFRRVRCPKQKKRQNIGSIRIEKYVQIARATFGFSTLVPQSFDLHLQSKDTDLDYEGNVQAKVFLRRVRWFLGRTSFFRSNNIHSDRF